MRGDLLLRPLRHRLIGAATLCRPFDDRFALDSGLAPTIAPPLTNRENGLSQAWESLESVRIDADIVVLSACETRRGEPRPGEGLLGLSRAFQHAGARNVVASLWNVADVKTSALMTRFYGRLIEGEAPDAALRAAQLELLRGPVEIVDGAGGRAKVDATAPVFWAGFVAVGNPGPPRATAGPPSAAPVSTSR